MGYTEAAPAAPCSPPQAPAGEASDGPVLLEAPAPAQLFGQLLGDHLKITRKPIADAGRSAPYVQSELENRVGSRILPEWMDVVDDPTQTAWRGHTLLGHYSNDIEGVRPAPLTLVEKGTRKTFFLTRKPALKAFADSNGHDGRTGAKGGGGEDILVGAGGIIPDKDIAPLKALGIREIFLPGTSTRTLVAFIQKEGA